MTQQTLPHWALQRVAALLAAEGKADKKDTNSRELARRAGLSKSLTRRCINHLKHGPHDYPALKFPAHPPRTTGSSSPTSPARTSRAGRLHQRETRRSGSGVLSMAPEASGVSGNTIEK
jgi:hypothetical protein